MKLRKTLASVIVAGLSVAGFAGVANGQTASNPSTALTAHTSSSPAL